jgi:hypothetical protein
VRRNVLRWPLHRVSPMLMGPRGFVQRTIQQSRVQKSARRRKEAARTVVVMVAVALSMLWQSTAGAQASEPTEVDGSSAPARPDDTPAPAAGHADVVLTKQGRMVRCTILELVPHDHITVETALGETLSFSIEEVVYAGPASGAPVALHDGGPASAPSEVPAEAPEVGVAVRFSGSPEGVTFFLKTDTTIGSASGLASGHFVTVDAAASSFRVICAAPCEQRLEPGTYNLAIGVDGKEPIEGPPVTVAGEGEVHGEWISNHARRTGGLVTLVGGGLVGLVLTGVAKEQDDGGLFLGGLGTILASFTVGLVLGLTPDDGRITFRAGPPRDLQR